MKDYRAFGIKIHYDNKLYIYDVFQLYKLNDFLFFSYFDFATKENFSVDVIIVEISQDGTELWLEKDS